MSDQNIPPAQPVESSDDRILAALAYVFSPLVPIIILFLKDKKDKPVIKAHNIQALVLGVILYIVTIVLVTIISTVTLGIGAICSPLISLAAWAILIYYGYLAYQGKEVVIPVITKFVRDQGWA